MSSRRTFLKEAATGALLLGAGNKLTFAEKAGRPADSGKSKVVIARDPAVFDAAHQLIPTRVEALLDRAITSYTGHKKPVDAWKQILGAAKVVGLKTNGLGGKGICTHAALAYAVAARLQQAGIQPGNIIIWDRNARDLQVCGLAISTDRTRVRCFGSDVAGYEEEQAAWGSARIRLSKILTRECDLVIGLPILKDHSMSGVTFAMKNMYGAVDRPQDLHAAGCNPGVADLNCIPAVRDKVRFTIGDALSAVYDGGPGYRPERLWYPNALIMGQDRVALDHTAWQIIERKRAESGMKTLEAAGRPPRYITTAADAQHALGTNDPTRMNVMEV